MITCVHVGGGQYTNVKRWHPYVEGLDLCPSVHQYDGLALTLEVWTCALQCINDGLALTLGVWTSALQCINDGLALTLEVWTCALQFVNDGQGWPKPHIFRSSFYCNVKWLKMM